jgi:hypothetical protein
LWTRLAKTRQDKFRHIVDEWLETNAGPLIRLLKQFADEDRFALQATQGGGVSPVCPIRRSSILFSLSSSIGLNAAISDAIFRHKNWH